MCYGNIHSLNNKALSVANFVVTQGINILALNGTWLGTDSHPFLINKSVPTGCGFIHISTKGGKTGSGVGIIYRSWSNVTMNKTKGAQTTFKHMDSSVSMGKKTINMLIIYRPTPSRQNMFLNFTFFSEWSAYLDELVITGDLNFHLDNKYNSDTKLFNNILESHGLRQYFTGATHNFGHPLDGVISRELSCIMPGVPSWK